MIYFRMSFLCFFTKKYTFDKKNNNYTNVYIDIVVQILRNFDTLLEKVLIFLIEIKLKSIFSD